MIFICTLNFFFKSCVSITSMSMGIYFSWTCILKKWSQPKLEKVTVIVHHYHPMIYLKIYILAKKLASFMLNKIEGKVLPKALTAKTPIKYAKYKTSCKFFIFPNCKTCTSGSIENSKQVITTNMPTSKLNCSFRINLDGYF